MIFPLTGLLLWTGLVSFLQEVYCGQKVTCSVDSLASLQETACGKDQTICDINFIYLLNQFIEPPLSQARNSEWCTAELKTINGAKND